MNAPSPCGLLVVFATIATIRTQSSLGLPHLVPRPPASSSPMSIPLLHRERRVLAVRRCDRVTHTWLSGSTCTTVGLCKSLRRRLFSTTDDHLQCSALDQALTRFLRAESVDSRPDFNHPAQTEEARAVSPTVLSAVRSSPLPEGWDLSRKTDENDSGSGVDDRNDRGSARSSGSPAVSVRSCE